MHSKEWEQGYEDGFEDRPASHFIGTKVQELEYLEGYSAGTMDREEVDRSGSSNT